MYSFIKVDVMVMEIALKLKHFAIQPANAQALEWLLIGVKRDLDHKVLLSVSVISLVTWVSMLSMYFPLSFRILKPFF